MNVRERALADSFVEIGRRLGYSRRAAMAAFEEAAAAQNVYEHALEHGFKAAAAAARTAASPHSGGDAAPQPDGPQSTCRAGAPGTGGPALDLLIAVVGHPYLLFDDFLSFQLSRRLAALGARTVTQFALTSDVIEAEMAARREISWSYERELLGAVSHYLRSSDVDGVVFLTSFACGTFAVIGEMVDREIRPQADKPLLYLVTDELTGEAGIQTRLESFCDMIRERKEALAVPAASATDQASSPPPADGAP